MAEGKGGARVRAWLGCLATRYTHVAIAAPDAMTMVVNGGYGVAGYVRSCSFCSDLILGARIHRPTPHARCPSDLTSPLHVLA